MEATTRTLTKEDGTKVVFPRLTLEDLFSVSEDLASERESIARKLAEEEKLEKYEIYNIVLDIRAKKPSVHEILALCGSAKDAHIVLSKSLTKAGKSPAEQKDIIKDINIVDCLDTARMLVMDVQEEKQPEPKNDEAEKKETTSPTTPSTGEKSKEEKIAELQKKAVAESFQSGPAGANPQ